jgi:RNA 2',3'-cyclic 3'-phosphodiesterase
VGAGEVGADIATDTLRAFIAVRVSIEVEGAIDDVIAHLRSDDDGIRWVSSANLHLTLKFLGPAVPIEKIRGLQPELAAIAANTNGFEVEVTGVGGFPDLRRPNVLWVGLCSEPLIELATRIDDAASRCGFERERRAFNPHLTIGRLKRPCLDAETRTRIEAAKNRAFGTSTIREMTLYRSITGAGGATYDALAKFQFKSPS